MVVDDDPLVRESLRRLFEANGDFQVVSETESAEEALNQAPDRELDLVVIDIRLPGMDGIEGTRRLKALRPQLKVVVISAYGQDYENTCLEAGAEGFLSKTLAPAELVSSLRRLAEGQPI